MADGLLPGPGKKHARQALRALCGGHSSYRDAKVSFRLRLQLQVRITHVSCELRCSCRLGRPASLAPEVGANKYGVGLWTSAQCRVSHRQSRPICLWKPGLGRCFG